MNDDATKPHSGLFSISWLCAIHLENDVCQDTLFLINRKHEHFIDYKQTLPKALAIDDDESVISSITFSPFSIRKSRLRIIPYLGIAHVYQYFQNAILHYSLIPSINMCRIWHTCPKSHTYHHHISPNPSSYTCQPALTIMISHTSTKLRIYVQYGVYIPALVCRKYSLRGI